MIQFFQSQMYGNAMEVSNPETKKHTIVGLGSKTYTREEILQLLEKAYAIVGESPHATPKTARKKRVSKKKGE